MRDAGGTLARERVPGPEHRALVVVEDHAREAIRSRLRDDGDLAEARSLGAVARHVDLHFLERLGVVGERPDDVLADAVGHRRAVDREHGLVAAAARERVAGAAHRQRRRDRQIRPDARIVERQGPQLLRRAHVADALRLELDRRIAGSDLQRLQQAAHLQHRVDAADVARDEHEIDRQELAEPGRGDAQRVRPFPQLRHGVDAFAVGGGLRGHGRVHVRGDDGGAFDHAAARVGDGAGERGVGGLRLDRRCGECEKDDCASRERSQWSPHVTS